MNCASEIGKFVRIENTGKALNALKKSLVNTTSVAEANDAISTIRDMRESIGLSNDVVENFCKKIANGYSSDRFVPASKNSKDYFNFCRETDTKAKEILEDKMFLENRKERLIGAMKAAPCLSHLDDEVLVGLAKSISTIA